jgi:triosephosphate isomerase
MKLLMAANWKMHKTRDQAAETARELVELTESALPGDREVLLFPPFTCLSAVADVLKGRTGYSLGGQNFYPAEQGAFTGEISPDMLADAGCASALVGHSERRHVLGEEDDFLARKVSFGLEQGLNIVLCIGETLEQRKAGQLTEILQHQLQTALKGLDLPGIETRLSVAYEPVWAIGTGEVAQTGDIAQAHAMVRENLTGLFGTSGEKVRILYGGSVKPDNTADIISIDNVDGVLVGGAGLHAESFSRIVLAKHP